MRPCSITGCTGAHLARGWCGNHWKRWKKYGDPLGSTPKGAHLVKPPLYVLPHGIEVIGEYAPNPKCPYWRMRIRPHRFFPDVKVVSNGIHVRRNRVLLVVELGRALTPQEHAHHGDEVRDNDTVWNLRLLTAAEHSRHHKSGSRHTEASKARIAEGLRKAYADGRRELPVITNRDHKGKITA